MMVKGKRGQLALFVILAIILVVGMAGFFIFREQITGTNVPNAAKPVYDSYLTCIEGLTKEGISILGSRGGYIETPEFEPGSPYMPFSSQLDFLGTPVPYWFYISGNNIVKDQVPTMNEMETELQEYIQDNLQKCDFSDFEQIGYIVDVEKGSVIVNIDDDRVVVNVKNELRFSLEENFYRFNEHKVSVNSKLGKFYNLAKEIYDFEQREKFLDNYALDTLTLNAPTSGFEEGCTPIIFNFNEIRSDVAQALSENIAFVKAKGSYYSNEDEYFVADIGFSTNENVNFMYSTQWPTKIEIYGNEFAEPVGLQEGMAMLGFCFVEYQLIYDVAFPVLVQIYDEKESFQFPVVVMVERNQVRKDSIIGEYFEQEDVVCKNRNQEMEITTEDSNGNPVPATISFSCLGERCYTGETKLVAGRAYLKSNAPTCVNGFIEARAEGYSNGKYLISSNEESQANVIMKKIYNLQLDLGNIPGEALVQFISDDFSRSLIYPRDKSIQLVEGIYDVKVQVFRNSSLTFPARTEKKCFETTASGFMGLLGESETKCYDVNIPAQEIDRVLVGGGNSVEFISEDSLNSFSELMINVPLFSAPTKIEEINENYIKLEDSFVSVSFA